MASEVKLLKFKYHLPENPQFLNIPTALPKTPAISTSVKATDKENSHSRAHAICKSTNKKHPHIHAVSQNEHSRRILQTE